MSQYRERTPAQRESWRKYHEMLLNRVRNPRLRREARRRDYLLKVATMKATIEPDILRIMALKKS